MISSSRGVLWSCLAALILPCCHAIQYAALPLDLSSGDCALVLGSDRSSLYDYGTNLLRGTLGYGGGVNCITYDAINQAYIDARKRIPVTVPPVEREWKTEEIAKVGELLLDITVQITKAYGLTIEEVESLPQIDTSKTLIQEVCPPYLSNVECHPGKYRRLDGLCNNIENPSWGATMTPFTRLMPPQFADGLNAPRQSVLGHALPLPRIVSRTMHPDDGFHDHAGTVMVVAWGQFMDHDFTLTATPLDARNKNDPEECCDRPPHLKHPYCLEIIIPDDDYFYKGYNVKCMDFVRSFPSVRPGCRLGSKTPYNTLTGVIDGNTVYGVNDEFGRHLRSGYGGELRMNPVFAEYGLKDLLPLKLDIPDEGCTRTNSSQFCFEAGEIRVNEQLVLTCMHTMMAREHNRVAKGLAEVNPHWDDETLYQEARRIVIAEIQHITYNEFLPIVLGKDIMEKFGLMLQKEGYWEGYDSTVNPNIIAAFSAAAFRFGHSLLPTAVERWSKAHKFIASKRLSNLIRRPYDLYRAGVLDEYLMGLMNQVAQAMDDSITQEVTNHLLKKPGNRFGLDLVAFNMQRGREFGVPGYMQFRKFCGLPVAETFDDLFGSMPNSTVYRYASIFDHPNDIDLWSGGVSERPLPGSMVGPTFACVIATQMSFVRRGDRFWYELPHQPSSFTPEQLQELRKVKLSRVLCDNTDLLDTIQIYPMVLPDHEINPRVPCKAGIIPSLDLTKWAEFPSPAHYNTTRATFPNFGATKCSDTTGCRHLLRNTLDPGIPPMDLNTVDYDVEHDSVDTSKWGHQVKNISSIKSSLQSPTQHQYTKNNMVATTLKKNRINEEQRTNRLNVLKHKLAGNLGKLNSSKIVSFVDLLYKKFLIYPKKASYVLFNLMNAPTRNKQNHAVNPKSKTAKFILDDLISKYSVIKKRSITDVGLKSVIKDSSLGHNFMPLKRSDRGNHDSFLFFSHGSNEDDIDPVSTIFDKDFLFGGTERGHEDTTQFPMVDKDYDYTAEYDYIKANSPSNEELGSEETYEEDKEGDVSYESNEDPGSSHAKPKENSNVVTNVVKVEENKESNENEDEEEDEDVDVIREPPIIVLYKGGDSKQLQPSFEYALTHGGLDPRYLTKDPLAGPLATQGFNHHFQPMRGVPIQGNVVMPNRRYPTVGGFNTTQIHAIIQTGQLPATMPGNNNATTAVVPVAPADYVNYARPMSTGQVVAPHPYPANTQYIMRPASSFIVRPTYYGGRGRRPPSSVGPIRSPSAVMYATTPRYIPSYRGHMRYRGNRNHMARYRPVNVGIPRGTRVAILRRRESNDGVESTSTVHAR